jgi:hypothetical protein
MITGKVCGTINGSLPESIESETRSHLRRPESGNGIPCPERKAGIS